MKDPPLLQPIGLEFGLIILKSQDFDFIGCFPEREDQPDFSIMAKLLNLESIVKADKRPMKGLPFFANELKILVSKVIPGQGEAILKAKDGHAIRRNRFHFLYLDAKV